MIYVNEIIYDNFGKCIKLENDKYELIISIEFGPRILSFKSKQIGDNILKNDIKISKKVLGDNWNLIGGHRFWHGPEKIPDSYIPDNSYVDYNIIENGIIFNSEEEKYTKLEKKLEITFTNNKVKLKHILINRGIKIREACCWGITVLKANGYAKIKDNKDCCGLNASKHISFWPYSNIGDSRICFLKNQIAINVNLKDNTPLKIGFNGFNNEIEYCTDKLVFIKSMDVLSGVYPDHNSPFQIYTKGNYIELETLSPIISINKDESIEHIEYWEIKGVNNGSNYS